MSEWALNESLKGGYNENDSFSNIHSSLSQYKTCLDELEKDHMDIMKKQKSFFFFNVENT